MKLLLKNRSVLLLMLLLFLSMEGAYAQHITGLVKSKSSTIYFEDFGTEIKRFDGQIKSNFVGSKYSIQMTDGKENFSGEIKEKFSKFVIDIKYGDKIIKGEIELSPNHTVDEWDIEIFGKKLSGTVDHNIMNTEDFYELIYDGQKISGSIFLRLNHLVYDLKFGKNNISGKMAYNISTVKHKYELNIDGLTEEEFEVLFFIECIKLLNEFVDENEDF